MNLLNSILIEGEVLADPLFSSLPEGLEYCTFDISAGDTAPAVPVVVYSRLALRCSELLSKGSGVRVVGRITQDPAASEAEGSQKLRVVAEHVEVKPTISRRVEVA